MIYFLYGNDVDKRNKKKQEILGVNHCVSFGFNNFDRKNFSEYFESVSLLGDIFFVSTLDVFSEDTIKSFLLENLEKINNSKNIFIFSENKVNKDLLKKIQKYTENIFVFEKKEVQKKENPFVFTVSDFFIARDKKNTWMSIFFAYEKNISTEEIIGTLFWSIKSMIVAIESKDSLSSCLNPYVYLKMKKQQSNFQEEELEFILFELNKIYHLSHAGLCDGKNELEKFVLNSL